MSNATRLYDLMKLDFPHDSTKGFRTKQVSQCWVCRALTNSAWLGRSLHVDCPHGLECWHHVLEIKLRWLKQRRAQGADVANLVEDAKAFRARYADRVKHDIVGDPDIGQEPSTSMRTFLHEMHSFCRHSIDSMRPITEKQASNAERDMIASEEAIRKIKEIGPHAAFEKFIEQEHRFVRASVRHDFYGFEVSHLLFPDDDSGPRFGESSVERWSARDVLDRSDIVNDLVFQDEKLLQAIRMYHRLSMPEFYDSVETDDPDT